MALVQDRSDTVHPEQFADPSESLNRLTGDFLMEFGDYIDGSVVVFSSNTNGRPTQALLDVRDSTIAWQYSRDRVRSIFVIWPKPLFIQQSLGEQGQETSYFAGDINDHPRGLLTLQQLVADLASQDFEDLRHQVGSINTAKIAAMRAIASGHYRGQAQEEHWNDLGRMMSPVPINWREIIAKHNPPTEQLVLFNSMRYISLARQRTKLFAH